ncbi:hypothetical protein HPB47_012533 [Ixodes persulcatus]|uniref:Uncharacterized protein n=1 Tax=Ixodes persulcatus TaxID=34615 RepID=A0AC60NT79_IXOPE|nr:hypothetical protein HPB47_012533 [Ixodes persulcatus]
MAHWIDGDWVLPSATLQGRHVPERHTAEQCAREVLEAAMAWEIDQKVEAVCTDNARNICFGVERDSFQSLKCAAHTLQLCIHKVLSDDGASKATVPRLTDVDWDMIEQLWEALRSLLEVTELLGRDKYVTQSVLILAIKLLKNKIRVNDCDPAFICCFKALLVDSIDERLSAWPHYNDYEMATCLDPRFKSVTCIGNDRREQVWQGLSQLAHKATSRVSLLQLSNLGQARKRLKRWNDKDESIKDLEERLRDGALNLDGFLQKMQQYGREQPFQRRRSRMAVPGHSLPRALVKGATPASRLGLTMVAAYCHPALVLGHPGLLDMYPDTQRVYTTKQAEILRLPGGPRQQEPTC